MLACMKSWSNPSKAIMFDIVCLNEKSLNKYDSIQLQETFSLKGRQEASLVGTFANVALKSCSESNVYLQLE